MQSAGDTEMSKQFLSLNIYRVLGETDIHKYSTMY